MEFENASTLSEWVTQSTPKEDSGYAVYTYVGSVFAAFIISINAGTMAVLIRCRKLMRQVRFLSLHLTVNNMGYGITILVTCLYNVLSGTLCPSMLKILPVFMVTYYLFLTCIGLDRLLALVFPMDYTFWSSKKKSFLLAFIIYCLGIVVNIPNLSQNFDFECHEGPNTMFSYTGLVIFTICLQFLLLTEIITYSCIGYLVLKFSAHNLNTTKGTFGDLGRYTKITMKSLHLCILTAILTGPFLAIRCVDIVTFKDNQISMNHVTIPSVFLVYVHQIASPVSILCSYKECRYVMLSVLYLYNKERQRTLLDDYRQYYASYDISPERNQSTSIQRY